jgi:hypothetical protein
MAVQYHSVHSDVIVCFISLYIQQVEYVSYESVRPKSIYSLCCVQICFMTGFFSVEKWKLNFGLRQISAIKLVRWVVLFSSNYEVTIHCVVLEIKHADGNPPLYHPPIIRVFRAVHAIACK